MIPRGQYLKFLSGSSVLPRLRTTAKNLWVLGEQGSTIGQPVIFVKGSTPDLLNQAIWGDLRI